MKLVKSASIRWFGTKPPKFERRPALHIFPISKDVELVTVDFCERWLLVGSGGGSDEHGKNWHECLVYSSNKNPKIGFEVVINLSAPASLHGSPDKTNWDGVIIRKSAEDAATDPNNIKNHKYLELPVRKS